MEDKQLKRYIESAGGWFVAEYAFVMWKNFDRLEKEKEFKSRLTTEIFDNRRRDSGIRGTRTRVSSVLSIIRMGKIEKALEYVVESKKIISQDPLAVEAGKVALEKIRTMK